MRIGTDNTVQYPDVRYIKTYVATVTDAGGAAVKDVEVTLLNSNPPVTSKATEPGKQTTGAK